MPQHSRLAKLARHGALLYGAFGVHLTLALFGLSIPLLPFGQVVSTRTAHSWYGEAAQYQRIVANLACDGATGWQRVEWSGRAS